MPYVQIASQADEEQQKVELRDAGHLAPEPAYQAEPEHHHRQTDNRSEAQKKEDCIKIMQVISLISGIVCLIIGVYYLVQSNTDTRGAELADWSEGMARWEHAGLADFRAQHYGIAALHVPAPPGPPPPAPAMELHTGTITPTDFGETHGWSDEHHATPNSLTTAEYKGTAHCPGKNQPCSIRITGANPFNNIKKDMPRGAAMEETKKHHDEAKLCQWYDTGMSTTPAPPPHPSTPQPQTIVCTC